MSTAVKAPNELLPRLKSAARAARDVPLVNRLLLAPFKMAKSAGIQLPHGVYQHLPYRGLVSVDCGAGRRFSMRSYGHQLENGLFWRGLAGHEPETLPVWIRLAERSKIVLDIGANTGLFSLAAAAASPRAEVHAFEPVARIHALLVRNVALNPGFNITPHECAIGAEEGTLDLHDPGGDICYSASLDGGFLKGATTMERYPVRVRSVDAIVRERGWSSVDLVKLDIEGYEDQALAGMATTLEKLRPIILIELLEHTKTGAAVARLTQSGYVLYSLSERGPMKGRVPHAPGASSHASRNVLLVPEERCSAVDEP